MRPLPLLFGALLLTAASAQPPLAPPVYYLSTAPRLVEDRPLQGELGPGDGQNFKDGACVYVYTFAGEVVAEADDSFTGTDARLQVELEPGRYELAAAAFAPEGAGPYHLEVAPYRPLE